MFCGIVGAIGPKVSAHIELSEAFIGVISEGL